MNKLVITGCSDLYTIPKQLKMAEWWGLGVHLMLPDKNKYKPYLTKLFEIHRKDEYMRDTGKYCHNSDIPLYMWVKDKQVKNRLDFPFDDIIKKYGRYHCSSFSLILCFAVEQGYKDITLFDIDYYENATFREMIVERANLEYWIGYFRGQGITVDTQYTNLLKNKYIYGKDDICKHIYKYRNAQKRLFMKILGNSKDTNKMISLLQLLKTYNKKTYLI